MTAVEHPAWCSADESCTAGQRGGRHTGPFIVVAIGDEEIHVELCQAATPKAKPRVRIEKYTPATAIVPAVVLDLALTAATDLVLAIASALTAARTE